MKKEKTKKLKIEDLNISPSEKVTIALANGILINLQSSEKDLNEMSDLGVRSINSIMQFNENLNQKKKRGYIA